MNIRKYTLDLVSVFQPVLIPEGGKVIHVAAQNNLPNIWVLVNPDAALVTRKFYVAGTGRTLPDNVEYLGTCHEQVFVWHVFEVKS